MPKVTTRSPRASAPAAAAPLPSSVAAPAAHSIDGARARPTPPLLAAFSLERFLARSLRSRPLPVASWPHAALSSSPRCTRTVQMRPRASTRFWKARTCAAGDGWKSTPAAPDGRPDSIQAPVSCRPRRRQGERERARGWARGGSRVVRAPTARAEARVRIVRDDVDARLAGQRRKQRAQLVCVSLAVVDAGDERDLHHEAAVAPRAERLEPRVTQLHHRVARRRHEDLAQRVVGCMRRPRQPCRQRLERDNVLGARADGGDAHMVLAERKAVRVHERRQGRLHVGQVVGRLAHSHEDDVAQPRQHRALARNLAHGRVHLRKDLLGVEGAAQAHRACQAETARLPATDLRGDAQGAEAVVLIRDDDRLDLVTARQLE